MPTIILYVAMSLDGYVAREDGSIDWLSTVERKGEDHGFAAFYEDVDSVVMGRHTYEFSAQFEPWPYPGKASYVLSSRVLGALPRGVEQLGPDVQRAVRQMERRGATRIWLVGGGRLVSSFLRDHRIDEMIISILPILLGGGLPLFPPPLPEIGYELLSVKQFDTGLVQLHCRCANARSRRI